MNSGNKVFQRARQPDQKAHRREQILETARAMLSSTMDSRKLSLNALAAEAGMAKSNMYRYFESREAVLMAVLGAEWRVWHESVLSALSGVEARMADEALAGLLASEAAARPLLCHLVSVLPSVLEHNVHVDTVMQFKLQGLQLQIEMAKAMHRVSPGLTLENHQELLFHSATLIIGAWPLSQPPKHLEAMFSQPPFDGMRHDFEADMARALSLMMAGMRRGV